MDNPNHKGNVAELAIANVISVSLSTSRRGPDGYVRRNYSSADVDAIGAYCEELHSCFLIPIGAVADQWAVQLRWHRPEMDNAPHYTSRTSIASGL